MPEKSLERRSAQTALYHITHALTRMIAPILSFTAEELWQTITDDQNIFKESWYEFTPSSLNQEELQFLREIEDIRPIVNKSIEAEREKGLVGSALECDIQLSCKSETFQILKPYESELHYIFIVSRVSLIEEQQGLSVSVKKINHDKCDRCWHFESTVGTHQEHPSICERCTTNLFGDGEKRKYA
jgi:isoleucyl-tRNA synthetase